MAKRLTKAQVRKKLVSIQRNLRTLLMDKMDYAMVGIGSEVPFSPNAIIEIGKKINQASKRL